MKIKPWITAFRLRTLPLSLSGIILGSFIALSNGFWNWSIFIFSVFTTVLFQILSNLANDLGDSINGADSEQRIGPVRAVQSGEISMLSMKRAVYFFSFLSLVSAVSLIYFSVQNLNDELLYFYFVLAFLCIAAAIFYTVGKKAYGYNGLGDVFVFIFFGLVSLLGVYTLYSSDFDSFNILPAISIGFLSTAVLNLNNMRDQVNDKNVGKNTIVVKIGSKNAVVYHVFLIVFSFISMASFMFLEKGGFGLFALLPFLLLFKHILYVLRVKDKYKMFDSELKKVAILTFILSITSSIILNL